jgi:multisubunit Na+/H+ antiporter MnhC subunit
MPSLAAVRLGRAGDRCGNPLMADLGTVEPSFDLLIAAVVIGMALIAVALGMAPTAWRLHRQSIASVLSQEGP